VAPTLDFIQQLRTYGSELEILQPQSLREQFKAELEKQLTLYK
jgi:predicted DNA-binding transcriptional regulator YafY